MPGDKIPIPQFAAKIKAKYPEYKDVNDTLLVQKIIAKYPEYKEQVEFEPVQIQEPVKKKEQTGGIGSVIGGQAGSSAGQSEKGLFSKLFDLATTPDKETYDPVSEATKPHREILAEAQGETKQLVPNLQRSDATAVKPYVDINTALKKANTIRDIEANAFPDISTAIQWKDKMDSGALSPKNRTTQLARKIVTDAENTVSALKNSGADYDKGAIEYAMSSNDAFGEAVRKMVKDGKPLDDFVKGEAAMRYLGSRFFRELPDDSPVKQGVIAAAKEAQQKYPSMYFRQLNEKISAKREEMGMNNWFYNEPGVSSSDKAMDALRKEGKISDGEEMAYVNAYRPMMQAGINPGIKTPGFVESTGESISHQLKSAVGLLEDVGEATGASRLYSTVGGDIRRELREQQQMIKEPNWSYGHQVSRAAGNLTGLIATMGGEGVALKGLGLGANATNAVATGLNFFHDIYKAEEQKHGKGDPMAYLSAITQTLLWSEGTKIFGNAFNDVIKSSKGEVNDILKSLQDGTIQNSDATQSIMNVLLNKITKGGKEAIKDVAKIKGIEVLNGTLSNLFNGQLDIKTPINDALHDTPTFFLSLLPVKVMGAKGKDMTKDYLSSLVKYPELAENITDPKAKQNYESLVKLEPFLNEQGLNNKQKDNYRLLYLKGKILEEQSGALPDKGLSGQLEKNIKENEIAKKAVVDPEMGNKKIVQEFYDNDLLDKGSKMMLENEEGKFSESKVGEYLKSIAQQENGLDENWKPLEGGGAKLKGRVPDTIIELANERWKKEIEAAKPEEEIKEPEAPKIKGTPEDISQPIELNVEPVTEGKEQPSEASTGLSRGDETGLNEDANKILGLHDNGVNFDLFDNNKLRQIAKDNGIDLPEGAKNADIIKALKDKQAELAKSKTETTEDINTTDNTDTILEKAQKKGSPYAELIKVIKDKLGNVKTLFTDKLNDSQRAYFDGQDIQLNKNKKQTLQTWVHEAIHALTQKKLNDYDFDRMSAKPVMLSESEINAAENLHRIYKEIKSKTKDLEEHYGLHNIHEFISEAFANPEFQKYLKTFKGEGKSPNIFKQFLDAVAKMLGLKDPTILDDIFHHTEKLMDADKPKDQSLSPNIPKEGGGLSRGDENLGGGIKNKVTDKGTHLLPISEIDNLRSQKATDLVTGNAVELEKDLSKNGIKEPLVITYYPNEGKAVLTDGHNRLDVAKDMGAEKLPIRIVEKYTDAPNNAKDWTPPKDQSLYPNIEQPQEVKKEEVTPVIEEKKPVDFIEDMEGKGFALENGEYKRNGIGLNIKRGKTLFVDGNGDVSFGESRNPKDIVLNEIKVIDESARGKGEATKALDDFLESADRQGYTIYIEPTPIKKLENKKNLTQQQLINWYEKRGFEKKNDQIWVREPKPIIEGREAEQPTVTTKEQVSNEAIIPEGAKSPEPIPTKEESTTGEIPVEVSQSAEGGEPPKPPVEEMPTQEEDKNIGITHAQTAELRKEAGLPEYEKEAETFAKWDEEAKQRIKNGEMPDVIKKIENGGQPSAVEQRMMGMHIADLKEKVNENPSDESLEKYHTALKLSDKMGGSEVGKSLVARKGIFQADESLADYFEREREVNNDAPLTESQKEQVKTEYQDISEAEKAYQQKIAGLEAENARLKAEQEIKKVKRSSVKRDFGAERKQIISDIKDKLKKARGEAQASIVPYAKELIAIAPDVGKLVTNLLEEGVTKLADITDRVFEELKEHIPALTKKDVNDLIAGEYNPKKPTRNETAKKKFELQQEAQLLNKLDEVLKGEEPKTEKKKVQRNQRLEEIRKQIKDIQNFDKEVEKEKQKVLKAKADEQKKNEDDLTKAEKEKAQKTAEERVLDAYKNRTKKEISRVEEQLKKGDFSREEKRQPLKLDTEATALKDKLIKLKSQREVRLMKQQYANRSKYEKGKDWVVDKLNIPRTIMSSMDYSAPLRQGLVAGISHPRTALKASLEMFRAGFSQKNFDRWVYEMRESPRYDIMTKSGLAVTDPHSPFLAAKEEAFMNNTAEKIPIVGKLIKGSERAYVMFLNKMRADLFNRFADRFEEQGKTYENSPQLYQATAKLINAETGRGDLGKALENAAPILNTVFFSPRLIASRMNLLTNWANPYWYKNTPKEVRVMYMKDMLKFIGLGMSVIALSKLSGADVEDDPRSSDFGKIKSGNTRWDIWGGFQQYVRLATQMAMGEKKSMRTGEIQELDSKGRFGEGREDVIGRFLRGKLAPVPSMAVDFFKGRTVSGDPVTWSGEAKTHFLPLIYSDVQEAMKDRGVSALFTVGVPSVFGVGVQTFNPNDNQNKSQERKRLLRSERIKLKN